MALGNVAGKAAVIIEAVPRMRDGLQLARAQLAQFGLAAARAGAMLTGVGVAGGVGIARVIKLYAEFDDKIRAANARIPEGGQNFELLKDKAKELGQTTSFTATQVADMMAVMGKMGFGTAENIANSTKHMLNLARATGVSAEQAALMAKRIAQASGMGDRLEEVADILAAASNRSAQSFEELSNAMEYAAAIARTTGMELSETASFMMVLADNGIVASKAGVALRAIFTRLVAKKDDLKKMFGLDIDGLNRIKQLPEIFKRINHVLKNKTPAERLATLNSIFGKIGLTATAVGLNTSEELQKLMKEMSNVSGENARIAAELDAGIGGSLRLLKSAFETLFLTIGEQLEPMIRAFAEGLKQVVKHLDGMLKTVQFLAPVLAVIVGVIFLSGVALLAMGFAAIAASVAIGILNGMLTILIALQNLASGGLSTLIPLLAVGLTAAIGAAAVAFGVFVLDLDEGIGAFIQSLRDTWSTMMETTKKFSEMMRKFSDRKEWDNMARTIKAYLGSILTDIKLGMGDWGKPFIMSLHVVTLMLVDAMGAATQAFWTAKIAGDNLLVTYYGLMSAMAFMSGQPGMGFHWAGKAKEMMESLTESVNKSAEAWNKWGAARDSVFDFFQKVHSGDWKGIFDDLWDKRDGNMWHKMGQVPDLILDGFKKGGSWFSDWMSKQQKKPAPPGTPKEPFNEAKLREHWKRKLGLGKAARELDTLGSFNAAGAAARFKSQLSIQNQQLHEQKEANKKLDAIIAQGGIPLVNPFPVFTK